MDMTILDGAKIVIVDDEPDIIETLEDCLGICNIDSAINFHSAKDLIDENDYDAMVLDIMGVNGYGLLEAAVRKNIPVLILTAHALTAENFKKSIEYGAHVYLPKDEMVEIEKYLADLILTSKKKGKKSGNWFIKLLPLFKQIFGRNWMDSDPIFWESFKTDFIFTKEEMGRELVFSKEELKKIF